MEPGKRQQGLALVEMVAGAALLCLIALFTLGLIPSFKVSNRRAHTELQAGAIAQNHLERARAAPFDTVVPQVFPARLIDGVSYRATLTVGTPVSAGSPPLVISKPVRVTVTWAWSERELETFRETILVRVSRS